ncbi:MAG: neutral zinc metallopeptidase [Burkholderiales bacterium]|nr:neutral zinc metallopeptidase [Burkholderiales bacterium]
MKWIAVTRGSRATRAESNGTSVRMELQADCYAGVWSRHVWMNHPESGDIAEALDTAGVRWC